MSPWRRSRTPRRPTRSAPRPPGAQRSPPGCDGQSSVDPRRCAHPRGRPSRQQSRIECVNPHHGVDAPPSGPGCRAARTGGQPGRRALRRAAWRVRWSRSARLACPVGRPRRTAGPPSPGRRRARAGTPPPRRGGAARVQRREGRQPGARTVGLADGHRAVEPHDRAVGQPHELVVPLDDLHPVGLPGGRRVGVQRGDRGLGLVLAQPVAGQRRLQDGDPLGDQARCPTGCGPARRAGPGCRRARSGPRAGRGAAASGRAARPPRGGRPSAASCRVSRIASAARSTSPE